MKHIKVASATPAQVSWLVTMIETDRLRAEGEPIKQWWLEQLATGQGAHPYATDWLWGGPLAERERIEVYTWGHDDYCAKATDFSRRPDGDGVFAEQFGETELLARMRCFVASVYGEEVDVPEGLL